MANPLNLYATRVFSEQPLAIWALDDRADYISFLSSSDQDLSSWSSIGVSEVVDATDDEVFDIVPPSIPFSDVFTSGVIANEASGGTVTFTSPFQIQKSNINEGQETFSFGLYLYSFAKIVNLRLGFKYVDPLSSETFEVIKSAAISPTLSWAMVSETFTFPEDFDDLELIIEAYYTDTQDEYQFAINSITAGQWAEEFQLESQGVNLIDVPSSIAIPEAKGLEAQPYGFPTNKGYYLANSDELFAKNFGLPLVFGSSNSTYIYPKENSPSLIVPGLGFMNKSGQFNSLTAEFWIKIQSKSSAPRRIFGPIGSDDGLYVEGPFLKIKVGNQSGTHYVREWDRPMLVDIRLNSENVSMILNGEEVSSFQINPALYEFPPKERDGLSLDWLGFYAYEDVPVIQIDCVGIYPYEVPSVVAKRRWVYGQAVQPPLDVKGSDSFSSVFVDYAYAKYARNYDFPFSSKWTSGSIENLVAENDALFPTPHELPEFRFTDKTPQEWTADIDTLNSSLDTSVNFLPKQINSPRINLRPNDSWDETNGHIFFKNLNFLETQTRSFYGLFETKKYDKSQQTLFEITNIQNSNTVKIYTKGNLFNFKGNVPFTKQEGSKVIVSNIDHGLANGTLITSLGSDRVSTGTYSINVITENSFFYTVEEERQVENAEDPNFELMRDSTVFYTFIKKSVDGSINETIFYTTPGQKINQRFFVGVDIPRFTRFKGQEIASFLGTRQRLLVYVGGNKELSDTFTGDIHRVGFCTQRNLNKISHLFNDQGLPFDYSNVFDRYGQESFDAGNIYFGNDPSFWSLVLDGGDPYDFPAITSEEHVASYTLLPKKEFDNFVIDIACDSYWEDYVPLSYFAKQVPDARGNQEQNLSYLQFNLDYPFVEKLENEKIDTSESLVKSYIAFQYLQSGSNATSSNFKIKNKLGANKVVVPGSDWLVTKYEVVDGTIIYPPEGVDINRLSINLYLEFVINGIRTNPVKIRSLELASQAYGSEPNVVGTKQGVDLVLFDKIGQYTNYKTSPALSIYKGSTPYLYNTSNSGIKLKVDYSNKNTKGISLPINSGRSEFFKIGTFQMSLKYDEKTFPQVPVKIFEIEHFNNKIDFFLAADSPNGKRGQIYAINSSSKRVQGGLMFFNNGIPVKRPILYSEQWTSIGISFPTFLNFQTAVGALRFTSPITFNNISYFQTNRADDEERAGYRQWFAVRSQLGEELDWGYWAGKEIREGLIVDTSEEDPNRRFDWEEVLFLSNIVREEIDGSTIYKTFTGTQRIVFDSDRLLPVGNYEYNFYNNVAWSSKIVNPV